MTSSAKVIEKLKHGIQDLSPEIKTCDKTEAFEEGVILPYRMGYLTQALVEEAVNDLHETEENRVKCLAELRHMVENEPNLVSRLDDTFLLAFLRSRKYNVKKAFKLVQNFWAFRKEHKKIYDKTDTKAVEELILRNFMGFLTERDRNGSIVFIMKFSMWNVDIDTYELIFQAFTAILLHSIEDPATQVAGYKAIMDTRGLCWNQIKLLTPSNIMLLIRSTQQCFPARYKKIYILTENKLFNLGWSLVYPFLTKKLKRRIVLLGSDLSPLLEDIHPSVLPVEYGGEHAVFDNNSWTDLINQDRDMVMNMLNYGYK